MLISDLKREFYDQVDSTRVLILVGLDVDAVCACKILQTLFQLDHVSYTLIPISGRQELEIAYAENCEQIKNIVLINCGGNIDIIELLQPEEDVIFYIIDSHRPLDICNVYNDKQIKLLKSESSEENIPEFDDVFRDDEESEEESDEADEDFEPQEKRNRLEMRLEKRRNRRIWEEKRMKILFNYTQFSFYGTSSAVALYDFAWKMSKDSSDLLWWAVIGLTDQFVNFKIEREKYMLESGNLQPHVSRHSHRNNNEDNNLSINNLKLTYDKDLQLTFYRHWSIYSSMCHTLYTSTAFRVWTLKGKKRLCEFFVDMGLPLVQSQQKYSCMDIDLKSNVKNWIESRAEKYDLNQIVYGAFQARFGFKNNFCAADIVFALMAILEQIEGSKNPSKNFLEALDCLSRFNTNILEKGIELSKKLLETICSIAHSFLDMNRVVSVGPFLYATLQEGTVNVKYFSRPICLTLLARYLLHSFVAISRSKKAKRLPLILSAPLNQDQGTVIVVGIPPLTEDSPKNFFGKAFEQAAEKTNSRIMQNNFETSILEMKSEDCSKFFDGLVSLLN